MIVDPVKNSVPRNESMLAHVDCVFEDVLGKLTNKEAKINVIGIGDGAVELVEYLQSDWANWEGRVETIVVGSSHIWNMQFHDDSFKDFWTKVYFLVKELSVFRAESSSDTHMRPMLISS